ncbi:hypothetical protein [Actinokineospora sp. NPDC004072]
MDVEFDVELETSIVELTGSRPLKELAPGDWTSVHVFIGPATGAGIERELGQPVELKGDGTYNGDYIQDGNLLVFLRDDEIVRTVSLGQVAAIGTGKYPADVVLREQGGTIKMVGPDGLPAGG